MPIIAAMLLPAILLGQPAKLSRVKDSGTSSLPGYSTPGNNRSRINSFNLNGDTISYYKNDKEFAYIYYLDSLLRQSKDLAVDTLSSDELKGRRKPGRPDRKIFRGNSDGSRFFNNPFVRIILDALAVFFIAVILSRLFFAKGFFKRNSAQGLKEETGPEELITDFSAFNNMINEAVFRKDYRLAIRYLYLQTLQLLHSKNLIEYSPEKTNQLYITELKGKQYQDAFASLTLNYEYIWYGRFEVDSIRFSRYQNNYKQFQDTI